MGTWKLYDISAVLRDAIAAAEAAVDVDTGEIPADWAEFLDRVQLERDAKALACAAYVRECLSEADAVDAEAVRLRRRAAAAAARGERVKSYLAAFLQPGEKLKSASVSIGWRKSSSVEVAEGAALPAEYVRVIPERREPDKRALADALKGGAVVEGVALVEKQNIQIR